MKDLIAARNWDPPEHWERFTVIDSHTGGEPFRIVIEGLPALAGESVIEMRKTAQENLDRYRKILTWEPRGHADMYGGWIGPPTRSDSDFSVLFVHNAGFSTMCGHGIIALGKVLVDIGLLDAHEPTTTLTIDTPAGQVRAEVDVADGMAGTVTFRNVQSFVVELDAVVEVPNLGNLTYDLAFGGAFYAYVDASSLGLGLSLDDAGALIEAGRDIKRAVVSSREIVHPSDADLGFLYGVIFTGPPTDPSNRHRSVCIFADGELDRSPTGTGVSGSLAILVARGELEIGDTITVESILGSVFGGRAVARTDIGGSPAVIPEISGTAHLLGRSELWVDPNDPLREGFFLR
jgi:proline racemase